MHITNDGGANASGLLALAQAMRKPGDVTVVAPRQDQSTVGHRKIMYKPLRAWEVTLADSTVAHGCVSVTPIMVDMTNHGAVNTLQAWQW